MIIWYRKFLLSESLDEFCRLVKIIIVICGKKWYVPVVDQCLRQLKEVPGPNGNFLKNNINMTKSLITFQQLSEPSLYGTNFLDLVPKRGPLYTMSPFSFFALTLCKTYNIPINRTMFTKAKIELAEDPTDDDEIESGYVHNSCFSVGYLEYLIKNVFTYGCMFNHALLKLNGCTTMQDTNAAAESWHKASLLLLLIILFPYYLKL